MDITSRPLQVTDAQAVLEVYRKIAAHPGGFIRAEEEVDLDYIQGMLENTVGTGLGMCAHDLTTGELVGFITARKPGPKAFEHVLAKLTIGVLPTYQSKGIGRRIFFDFLEAIDASRPDVLRVELIVRESNVKAIAFYESIGFRREGSFEKRIRRPNGEFETDIPMGWLKPGI
jgi:ribosomal protein S18 acetylase RimI-like enzyme